MSVRRCAAAVLASAAVFAPVAQPSPTPPSAPSEYVEVVPTAGGGAPAGPGSRLRAAGSSHSAVGAAADAVGSGDAWVIGLGAVLAAATLSVTVAAAVRRRPRHEPKGW